MSRHSIHVGVAFDGVDVWVTNNASGTVTKVSNIHGGSFTVGGRPAGIAFDGANIWVVNNGASGAGGVSSVTKIRVSDGVALQTITLEQSPGGIAFDGTSMWVVNGSGNSVRKLVVSPGS